MTAFAFIAPPGWRRETKPTPKDALLSAARLALRHLQDRHYNYGNDWRDHEAADVATALERAIDDAERGT